MYVPVDLTVEDIASGLAIEGALVKVFSENGKGVYGEMVTKANGKASFLLNGPQRYQARVFKMSTGFTNPIFFDVIGEAGAKNCFLIPGNAIASPSSTDPRLCMCSGYFRTPTGAPAVALDIQFVTRFHPILLDDAGILTERVTTRTDKNGWAQIQLIRHGEYDVLVTGYEDVKRTVAIPDASSCNLPDLIFEVVDSVIVTPDPIQVRLGATVDVYPEVFTSIGRKLEGTAKGSVVWGIEDQLVATMTVQWDKITIYGNAKGSTLLTARRGDTSITRIPDPPILPNGIPILVV
jgi:hypothetical protein